MEPKVMRLSMCQLTSEEWLGEFTIDSISKTQTINVRDRKSGREFLLEILNDKTVKVIRIKYSEESNLKTIEAKDQENEEQKLD